MEKAKFTMIHSFTPPGASGPFTSGILENSPNWRWGGKKWLEFENFRFLYLLEGRGKAFDREGREWQMQPGSLLIRRPGWPHRLFRSPRWKEFFVTAPAPIGALLEESGLIRAGVIHLFPGMDPALMRLCEEVDKCVRQKEPAYRFIGTLSQLMGEFTGYSGGGGGGARHSRLAPAVKMLEDPRYFLYSLPEIAAKSNLTYENFRKLFRREYGLSPGEYRIKVRMEKARDLLNRRELSIAQVGEALHYPDPYSFSRQFHKWTGVSPREYRRSLWL